MAHTYILPLDDAGATLEIAGGKGSSLARLAAAGLPVPGGFYVTTDAYRQFVMENDLQPRILAALAQIEEGQPAALESASQAIHALFVQAPIPAAIVEAIVHAYTDLPEDDPAVAVRSSATAEDLPDLSFAGQQETFLNIRGQAALLDAVRRCWASLWTARAIGYRLRNRIPPECLSLAVVVQLLVPAEAAGILFTANPFNGRRDQVLINASWGLGEAIVGGIVTPDSLTVEKATGRVLARETTDKETMTVRTATGTEEQSVPDELRWAPVLDDRAAAQLARLGVQIEELYAMPMDVEWACCQGKFAILQARPITSLPTPKLTAADWPRPNASGHYARGSVADFLSEPLSPLFATMGVRIYNNGLRDLVEELTGAREIFPDDMLVAINGYAYVGISLSTRQLLVLLMRLLPSLATLIRTAEERWRHNALPRYRAAVAEWQARPLDALSSRQLLEGVQTLLAEAFYYLNTLQTGTMGAAGGSEGLFTAIYDKLVRREGDPPAPTFLLGFDSIPIQAEKTLYDLAQWSKATTELADFLGRIPTSRLLALLEEDEQPPVVDAETWRDWHRRFHDYLRQYGHAIYDLDFAKPLPADDPTPILEAFKMYVNGQGTDPYQRQRSLVERRQTVTKEILTRLAGARRWLFRKTLDLAQWLAPLREDGITDIGLGYPLMRRMLHKLGNRLVAAGVLAAADDVFWLQEKELADCIDNLEQSIPVADWRETIRQRKVLWQAQNRLTPPPQLPVNARLLGINLDVFLGASTEEQIGDTLHGLGASPGRVTSTARVLDGPEDFGQMRPGDVLVARITTPAWTPLFAMASAIVTDVGGPLSHGSIVAREYGIPAVLGTGMATKRIDSGQTITVDGTAGTVILSDGKHGQRPAQTEANGSAPEAQRIYVSVGISELLPDPLSPLFASLVTGAVSRSAHEIIGQMLGNEFLAKGDYIFTTVNGYGYYAMTISPDVLWRVTTRSLLGLPRLLHAFSQSESVWRQEARPRYMHTVASWAAKDERKQTAVELVSGIEEILVQAIDYYNAVRAVLPTVRSSETQFSLAYNRLVKRSGDPPAQIFLLGFDNAPLRAEKALWDLATWCRTYPTLVDTLVRTEPQWAANLLEREEPPGGVTEMLWKEWQAYFQSYLNQFGHIIYDLDFAKPVPADDPSLPFQMLVRFLRGQGISPYERQRRAVEQRIQAAETILARLDPLRARLLRRLLAQAQHYAPLREDTLADVGLGWPVLRRMAQEVGHRLQQAGVFDRIDDVFWLTGDELKDLALKLDSTVDKFESLSHRIQQRREQWHAQKQTMPPQVLPQQLRLLGLTVDMQKGRKERPDSTTRVLKGIGTSPGRATGSACVIGGLEDFDKLQPGDVLVARMTTPAWTPLLSAASALVTDVGGPLSHGSIVAREYGIPAVLGTGTATQRIVDGQSITVDGDAGIVTLS